MTTPGGDEPGTERARVVLARFRAILAERRDLVRAELRAYPPPIPACDVHFNRLLEERDELSRVLRRVDELLGRCLPEEECERALASLLDSCRYFDAKERQRVLATFHGKERNTD